MDSLESRLELRIKIPKSNCNCYEKCICKSYIKCRNNCFCGNLEIRLQEKSLYSALTPDYNNVPNKKIQKNDSSVRFGNKRIIYVEKHWYHSPRYFKNIYINNKFKNKEMTPQVFRYTKIELEEPPNSV